MLAGVCTYNGKHFVTSAKVRYQGWSRAGVGRGQG